MNTDAAAAAFGPWNPGLQSQIPAGIAHLATLFRPENVFTPLAHARELADLTGLPLAELVVFRPERLLLHEVLVRVTADFSVPDGAKIEDLGINFRALVRTLVSEHIEPRMQTFRTVYDEVHAEVAARVDGEISALFHSVAPGGPPDPKRSWLATLLRRPAPQVAVADVPSGWNAGVIARWEARARTGGADVEAAACRALARVASALLSRHGEPWGTRELIATLASGLACNEAGAERIGAALAPVLDEAAQREGIRLVPPQEQSGGDEHQGSVGVGQEHAAAAAEASSPATSASTGASSR